MEVLYYIEMRQIILKHLDGKFCERGMILQVATIISRESKSIYYVQAPRRGFENMKIKNFEALDEYYTRLWKLVSQLKSYGDDIYE